MFAQYETYDPNVWKGSVYDTPAAASQPSGILPILDSILKVGGNVAAQYFQLQAVKEQSKTLTEQATALAAARTRAGMILPTVYPTSTAGFAGMSTSTLLILGLGGVAAIIMLKRR